MSSSDSARWPIRLRPETRDILQQVEALSGRPVEFLAEPKLPVLATFGIARDGATFHVLRYRPSEQPIDFYIAHQAGTALRFFRNPPQARFDFSATGKAQAAVERLLAAEQEPDETEAGVIPEFATAIAQWALMNLRSLPIGMRVEHWLATDYPGLEDLQITGMAEMQRQNAAILSRTVGRLSVPKSLLGPIAAYALFGDRLFGTLSYAIPYRAIGVQEQGQALLALWDDIPADPGHDRELVERWAEVLGMTGWYRWVAYTP